MKIKSYYYDPDTEMTESVYEMSSLFVARTFMADSEGDDYAKLEPLPKKDGDDNED